MSSRSTECEIRGRSIIDATYAQLRFPWWLWSAYGLMLGATAAVGATSSSIEASRIGISVPLWKLAVDEATSVAIIFGLTPLLVAWTARLDPGRSGWGFRLAGHLVGMLAFSMFHIAGMELLRCLVFLFAPASSGTGEPLALVLIYEGRKDALTYVSLAAGVWLLALTRRDPVPGIRKPSAASRLQIRDGSRRLWLDTADILWVEAAGNYIELHLRNRSILQRQTLSGAARELADGDFVRIHRSRLVNRSHMIASHTNSSGDFTVMLTDGRQISGSRRWRGAVDDLRGGERLTRDSSPRL